MFIIELCSNKKDVSVECTDEAGKIKQNDTNNPFIEPVQAQTVVDMKGTADFHFSTTKRLANFHV